MQFLTQLLCIFGALSISQVALAYDNSRSDNIVAYWGQNSYGATHENDPSSWQQRLATYCEDDTINAFPLAFVDTFFSTGGLPSMNLGNACNGQDSSLIAGTALTQCDEVASDIKKCQAKGKIITVSLGGANGGAHFTSDDQARQFADTIWATYLGGSSSKRPFGDAVLDGVDLDIEGGGNTGYVAFVNQLRSHFNGANKQFYITGAPQCPYPDEYLGAALNEAHFDAVYVQFYNNYCSVAAYSDPNSWNFASWDKWAKNTSPNKDVKVYIGALASKSAGGFGYVDGATLANIAKEVQSKYTSFGGVMFWDASQLWGNGYMHRTVKAALGGGAAPEPTPSASTSATPKPTSTSSRIITSRITGSSTASSTSDSTTVTATATVSDSALPSSTSTGTSTSTDSAASSASTDSAPSATPTPAPGSSCAGTTPWSADTVFNYNDKVSHNGHVFTAKWWTIGDAPGTTDEWGVWVDNGACSAKRDESIPVPAPPRNPRLGVAPVKLPKNRTPVKRIDARSHWSRRHRSTGH